MPDFKLRTRSCIIAITGYQPKGGRIRSGRNIKHHDGPTVGLTVTFPHEDVRCFNVPVPIDNLPLRKKVAFDACLLLPAEVRALKKLIEQFAVYVVNNHGWSRPYRPNPPGYGDCILMVESVEAKGTAGKPDVMETATSWF